MFALSVKYFAPKAEGFAPAYLDQLTLVEEPTYSIADRGFVHSQYVPISSKLPPDAPNSDVGTNIALGKSLALESGVDGQEWECLFNLWTRESGWAIVSNRGGSGAYGIPQSLPASKMQSFGTDYLTNPITQIRWGLSYIFGRYGSMCAADSFQRIHNWY